MVGSEFLCTKYVVTATAVYSGKCVYWRNNPISSYPTNIIDKNYVECILGLDVNKSYKFSVTYWKNNIKVLSLRSARTFLSDPPAAVSSSQTQVSSSCSETQTLSSSQTVTISSTPACAVTASVAPVTASSQTQVASNGSRQTSSVTSDNGLTGFFRSLISGSAVTTSASSGACTASENTLLTSGQQSFNAACAQVLDTSNQGSLLTRQNVVSTLPQTASSNVPTASENAPPTPVTSDNDLTSFFRSLISERAVTTSSSSSVAVIPHASGQRTFNAAGSQVLAASNQDSLSTRQSAISTSQQTAVTSSRQICVVSAIQSNSSSLHRDKNVETMIRGTLEPPHDKTNEMACAPSKDSDQPGHPPSLIRVFAVRMKKGWILSYLLSAQWSDWQVDLRLYCSHMA